MDWLKNRLKKKSRNCGNPKCDTTLTNNETKSINMDIQRSTSISLPFKSNTVPSHTPYPTPPDTWIHPEDPRFTFPDSLIYTIPRNVPKLHSIRPSPLRGRRRKALLIGINYPSSLVPLSGCIQDVEAMRFMLISMFQFPASMIRVLTDDEHQRDPSFRPTKANMITHLHWLVDQAQSGDSLFLHFSGHGYQVKDLSGDEVDGFDEAILPSDFETEGYILDDELHEILVRPLKEGVQFTIVFDSCHSGTALDLPYIYLHNGQIQTTIPISERSCLTKKEKPMTHAAAPFSLDYQTTLTLGHATGPSQKSSWLRNVMHYFRIKKLLKKNQKRFRSKADVIMFSSCQDYQTSADTIIHGQPRGAMCWALLEAIQDPTNVTYADLLFYTHRLLSNTYNQTPQISSGKPIDMYSPFTL